MPITTTIKAGDIIKDKFGTNKVITQKELDDMKRKQQGQISKCCRHSRWSKWAERRKTNPEQLLVNPVLLLDPS